VSWWYVVRGLALAEGARCRFEERLIMSRIREKRQKTSSPSAAAAAECELALSAAA
jgi:hypothetical protein